MHKRFAPLLLSVVAALFISACSGGMNIMDLQTPYTTASSDATLKSVGRTIITASAYQGWDVDVQGPGQIIATRHHAGRIAKVKITYTNDSFNIRYLDSDNLGYDGNSISSTYDEWVEDLRDEIQRRLSEL